MVKYARSNKISVIILFSSVFIETEPCRGCIFQRVCLLVVKQVHYRGWQSTGCCYRPNNKGGMCPKLRQSSARCRQGEKNCEKHGSGQKGDRKTKEPCGLMTLWRTCVTRCQECFQMANCNSDSREWWCSMKCCEMRVLDFARRASKQQTVTVMVKSGRAGWSKREAALWNGCAGDSAGSASKLKTCNSCNTGSMSRENNRGEKSDGRTLNLVLVTDAPCICHSLW